MNNFKIILAIIIIILIFSVAYAKEIKVINNHFSWHDEIQGIELTYDPKRSTLRINAFFMGWTPFVRHRFKGGTIEIRREQVEYLKEFLNQIALAE